MVLENDVCFLIADRLLQIFKCDFAGDLQNWNTWQLYKIVIYTKYKNLKRAQTHNLYTRETLHIDTEYQVGFVLLCFSSS